jgi:hypothetical protein
MRVDGFGLPFRFRLGSGSSTISQASSDELFLWRVEGDVGEYALQFVPQTVSADPEADPLAILGSHFKWETDFVRERLGVTVDEKSIRILQHPAGTPVLAWTNQTPPSNFPMKSIGTVLLEETPQQSNGSAEATATRYAAQATLLHPPDHLLHFAVTGMRAWTEDELQSQVLRTALSYFPLEETEYEDPRIRSNS